jgi:putative spermidine/putrescine transport system substrate-binding protein
MKMYKVFLPVIVLFFIGCSDKKQEDILSLSYEQILQKAKGSEVSVYMWGGDKTVNTYYDTFVIPKVKKLYDITLHRVPISEVKNVLQKLELEKNAHKLGTTDMIWINGENFKIAKDKGLLYGSFASKLPNYQKYIDKNNDANLLDFSEPTQGLEAPYGRAQFVMVYNSAKVSNPPQTLQQLWDWIKKHPNRFTYPAPPDFTGSAFVRQLFLTSIGGSKNFDANAYKIQLEKLFDKLNEIKPYMFKKGEYIPSTTALVDTLYEKGSIDFTFSYNPTHALNKIKSSNFPKTSKTAIFKGGTLANTHFLTIAKTAQNPAGAFVVINFLLSPQAQYEKAKSEVWGDGTVLDIGKLDETMKKKFIALGQNPALLDVQTLNQNQLPELRAKYLEQIEKLWIKDVLKN